MSKVLKSSGTIYHNSSDSGNTTNSYSKEFDGFNIPIPDEEHQVLKWLSPEMPTERHQAVRESRVEGVGDWVLRKSSFRRWRTSKTRTAKPVLFCYGDPGVGKTYISSLVIDTLSNEIDGDTVAVAHVYCDFSSRNVQSAGTVLGSVLRQVVGALVQIPDEIQKAFEQAERQADGCAPRLPEVLVMLTKSLSSLEMSFICIDALDEFPAKRRAQLWNSLQHVIRECPNTRLFLTGRPQIATEVGDYFPQESDVLTIEPTSDDVGRYIEERLEGGLGMGAMDERLRADIKRVLTEKFSGMFLLVCIGMDAILAKTTILRKRQALDRLAGGLGLQNAYNTTLDRIRQQGGGKSRLGMEALMWISRCERPLQLEELRHALGVELGAGDFNLDNIPTIRAVLGCTLGLVTVDERTSTVRLLHFTLEEHLREHPTLFVTAQSIMAEICLTYLNYRSARELQPDVNKALAASPFLGYATHFWGTHASREMTEQVKSLALRLLDRYENHVSAAILWQMICMRWPSEDVNGISGLHCIAYWGIAEIAITMLEKKKWDINARDSRGGTPLMWAVRCGNDSIVRLLLEQRDLIPDMVIRGGRTVLSIAAELGNQGAVRLILERRDVKPNSSDDGGRTPLSYAASEGYEGTMKMFLGRGDVSPNLSDTDGRTPLSYAVSKGHEGAVKLLVGCMHVNPNLSDRNGRPPLSYTSAERHGGLVRLLVENPFINPNSKDSDGLTPLLYAAKHGRRDLVQRFLEHRSIDPNLSGGDGRTPLSVATSAGHEGVVKLLLGRWNVNPNLSDRSGRPPLSYAAVSGDEALVKLFLKCRDVSPDLPDSSGRTPLSYAAMSGKVGVVKLFLQRKDVNPGLVDHSGWTPRSFAASSGYEDVVKMFLGHVGVDP